MKYAEYYRHRLLEDPATTFLAASSVKTFPSARDFVIRDHMGYKPDEPRIATLNVPNGDIKVRITSETVVGHMRDTQEHKIELDVINPIPNPVPKTRHVAVTKAIHEASISTWIIKKVIFNDPATIVYWFDGSRTVVKARDGEPFDPEKGLAMAICKKLLGTNDSGGNYYDIFKKWLPEEESKEL